MLLLFDFVKDISTLPNLPREKLIASAKLHRAFNNVDFSMEKKLAKFCSF